MINQEAKEQRQIEFYMTKKKHEIHKCSLITDFQAHMKNKLDR